MASSSTPTSNERPAAVARAATLSGVLPASHLRKNLGISVVVGDAEFGD
jgi:hypothetical protein